MLFRPDPTSIFDRVDFSLPSCHVPFFNQLFSFIRTPSGKFQNKLEIWLALLLAVVAVDRILDASSWTVCIVLLPQRHRQRSEQQQRAIEDVVWLVCPHSALSILTQEWSRTETPEFRLYVYPFEKRWFWRLSKSSGTYNGIRHTYCNSRSTLTHSAAKTRNKHYTPTLDLKKRKRKKAKPPSIKKIKRQARSKPRVKSYNQHKNTRKRVWLVQKAS